MSGISLSDERRNEFREAFDLFDRNRDGLITADELADALQSLGCPSSEQEIQDMIHEVDTKGRGAIGFNEFLAVMAQRTPKKGIEEEIRDTFKVFDPKGKGYLEPAELIRVMASLGEPLKDLEEAEDLIMANDFDGDGKLSYNDFVQMMHPAK
eukprot:c6105_g1_i1.p1 GENE.c6105_g1_i1~~c6105_g1_i1.p1  ORF type:complete len:165 (-),score=41.42 c6105_g1_i1:598-1056(-)